MKNLVMVTIILLLAVPSVGQASLVSRFDSSNEGWTTVGATSPSFSATGGNPGGYIYAKDVTGNPSFGSFGWGFFSPDTWDGDWTSYINGTIQFDLLPIGYSALGTAVVILSGSNYMYSSFSQSIVNGSWTHFETQIVDESFFEVGASFNEIIQNVTSIYIGADLTTSLETTALDNVQVGAVPIPAAVWLFGSGLIGLIGFARRKKS